MVTALGGFCGPVLTIVVGGNTVERASAARNEGSDKPSVVRVQWAAAGSTTTTVVDAERGALSAFRLFAKLLPYERRLERIRWLRWFLSWSSAVAA